MPTRWLTGHETADAIEALVPGSVARSTGVACYLKPEMLVEACHAVRDDSDGLDLVHLTNLCAVDYWSHFEVVYHLQSFYKNQFATLKVDVQGRDKPAIPSVVPVWHGAWMQECEAYDLFGIVFDDLCSSQRAVVAQRQRRSRSNRICDEGILCCGLRELKFARCQGR